MDYLPKRESELAGWLANFQVITSSSGAEVGLSAALIAAYETPFSAWTSAYQAASQPTTRTKAAITTKNQAKASIIEITRQYVGIIQKFPGTSDAMRDNLRITVTKPRTKRNKPAYMPGIEVTQVLNRDVWFKLWDAADPDNKGIAKDALGANVYSYVGATPPQDPSQWFCNGPTTRTRAQITVPGNEAATVWITAMWFNQAGSGPGRFPPAQANVASTGAVPVGQQMKIAA